MRNSIEIAAPPDAVWEVLADASSYSRWVVGPRAITRADADWPRAGSTLEYELGVGPASAGDRTTVVESVPPNRLVLRAELRWLGAASIVLALEPLGERTLVTMQEDLAEGVASSAHTGFGHLALERRNDLSLARLKRLVENRDGRVSAPSKLDKTGTMTALPIAVAGATGHVGGALLERFVADGRGAVRCLARDPSKLPHADAVEAVEGDLSRRETLDELFTEGCVAYFLVHALDAGGSLAEGERRLAENFADAARAHGAGRIVYLGGLVDEDDANLSPHMRSRVDTGRVLRGSGVPTVEFRASIVIGAGSFSFELIRRLVDDLPLLVLPDWVDNLAQPIALADVVDYLAAAAEVEIDRSMVVEIGGSEQISYRKLIEAYASAVDTRRPVIPLPVPDVAADAAARAAAPFTRTLPGDAQEALKLFESLRHTTVVRDHSADAFDVHPMAVDAAIEAALAEAA